jgi:6-phosphogluconolactonase/glucosamine-6-phosphate isomerase/deaminase
MYRPDFITFLKDLKISFFDNKILLSDERIVKRGSNLRNDVFFYNLIKKKLINKKNFYNFKGQLINKIEAKKLERQISKLNLEIAILALGSNGHIASIFKIEAKNKSNFYFIENSPKYPKKRFTISIQKISKCKIIYLIASSSHRKKEIMQIKNNFLIKKIKQKIQLLLIP